MSSLVVLDRTWETPPPPLSADRRFRAGSRSGRNTHIMSQCSKKTMLSASTTISALTSFVCLCIAVSTDHWLYALERQESDTAATGGGNVTTLYKRTATGLWRKCIQEGPSLLVSSAILFCLSLSVSRCYGLVTELVKHWLIDWFLEPDLGSVGFTKLGPCSIQMRGPWHFLLLPITFYCLSMSFCRLYILSKHSCTSFNAFCCSLDSLCDPTWIENLGMTFSHLHCRKPGKNYFSECGRAYKLSGVPLRLSSLNTYRSGWWMHKLSKL